MQQQSCDIFYLPLSHLHVGNSVSHQVESVQHISRGGKGDAGHIPVYYKGIECRMQVGFKEKKGMWDEDLVVVIVAK